MVVKASHWSILCLLLVSACSSVQERDSFGAHVPPPRLAVGDRFTFDNPVATWTVTSIKNGRVMWRSNAGDTQVTTLNPILPALEWKTKRLGSGSRSIENVQGRMFPLKEGNTMLFQTLVTSNRLQGTRKIPWGCRVMKEHVPMDVPAGHFDTAQVLCKRGEYGKWTFYFAPRIGYSVRIDAADKTGKNVTVRRLISFSKPSALVASVRRRPRPITKTSLPLRGYGVHLESFRTRRRLLKRWNQMGRYFPRLVAGRHLYTEQVHLPMGSFYRLIIGPISSKARAQALCKTMIDQVLTPSQPRYCTVHRLSTLQRLSLG